MHPQAELTAALAKSDALQAELKQAREQVSTACAQVPATLAEHARLQEQLPAHTISIMPCSGSAAQRSRHCGLLHLCCLLDRSCLWMGCNGRCLPDGAGGSAQGSRQGGSHE